MSCLVWYLLLMRPVRRLVSHMLISCFDLIILRQRVYIVTFDVDMLDVLEAICVFRNFDHHLALDPMVLGWQ